MRVTDITGVVFRKYEGKIYAVFPYEVDWNGDTLSYADSEFRACQYDYLISHSKPAKPLEYKTMWMELINMGYDLKLIKKREFKYYVSSCKKSKPHQVFNYLTT